MLNNTFDMGWKEMAIFLNALNVFMLKTVSTSHPHIMYHWLETRITNLKTKTKQSNKDRDTLSEFLSDGSHLQKQLYIRGLPQQSVGRLHGYNILKKMTCAAAQWSNTAQNLTDINDTQATEAIPLVAMLIDPYHHHIMQRKRI